MASPDSGRPAGHEDPMNFTATGDAKVGVQAGVVNGNVHIYDVDPSATPEKKFATARNLLAGNMPRRAEQLIGEAVVGDLRSNEVAYYWGLSVLSARSFDHLGQDEFATLQACTSMMDQARPDGWLTALDVIMAFVNCLIQQERFGGLPDEDFDQVIASYDALPTAQQEEIRRHLDLIMTGALQDAMDKQFAEEVRSRRMSGNRAERAWKFFEPVPCEPVPASLTPPRLSMPRRVGAGLGALLLGVAVVLLLIAGVTHRPLLTLAFVAGAGGGGYLLATKGLVRLVRREELAADAVRHGERAATSRYFAAPASLRAEDDFVWGEDDEDDERQTRKLAWRGANLVLVQPLVDVKFAEENPGGANKRKDWDDATRGLRGTFAADIRNRYIDSERTLSEVAWLITWYAKRAKERWKAGTLRAHRDQLSAANGLGLLTFLGVSLLAVGLLCGLAGAFIGNAEGGAAALVLGAVGAWIAYRSEIDVYAVQLGLYRAETAFFGAQLAEERAEFDRWTKELEDRPTDAEMARWLDYDKLYAKRQALNTHGLSNRDVMADAVLTEALNPCRRARVLFGPPRYSKYRIIVFLLTEGGLRVISTSLDFYTGVLTNQLRYSFRYEAISSARVVEVGVSFDSGRRSVVVLDDDGTRQLQDTNSLPLSQALRLSLMDGKQHIDVVAENFNHGFLDRLREDPETLSELALDSSGIKGAMRILESVAAEGPNWLDRERTRRNRRLLDFSKTLTPGREELMWHQPGSGLRALGNGSAYREPGPQQPGEPRAQRREEPGSWR